MKRILTLLGLGRVLKLTPSNAGREGVEIVEGAATNDPVVRPFSNDGTADLNLRLQGRGTGRVLVDGDYALHEGEFTAKGDVLVGTGAGTFTALGVGTDGHVLTLDSAQTSGVKWAEPAGGGLSDGDKGDVTVSSSGTVWTIDNDAVTYAKMQDVSATDRILGRSTAGAGIVEEITCTSFARQILDDADAATVRATIGAGTGSGDALTSGTLAQFASTTSLQLLGVMSDETGTGSLVFGTSPTLTTPRIAQINGVANGEISVAFFDAASAVNYFAFQSRATGNKPRISATGSDTNVGMVLATKGTGLLEVAPNGTSLREVVDVGASGENRTMVGKLTFPSGATNGVAIPDFTNSAHNHSNAAGGGTLDAAAIGSGTMATARLGSGSPSSTNALLGNQTYGNPAPAAHTTSHKDGGSDEIATTTAASGAIPKAGSNTKLDQAWIPESSYLDFAHPGTSEYEAWFAANCHTHTAFSAQTLVANRMYAMPFVAPGRTGVTIDRLGINVTTGSSGNARLGIYNDSSGYPGTLLLDAGTVVTTSIAVVTVTISQALTPGNRYWLVYVSNATPTVRSIPVNSCSHALGFSSALGTAGNCGLYVSFTYGALPTPFPSTPTMITANPIPALFYRFSA